MKKVLLGIGAILLCASVAYAVVIKDDVVYEGTVTYTTAPTLSTGATAWTVGSGAEADTPYIWDGNADDFHIGIDDSADDFVIGYGSTMGTDERLTFLDTAATAYWGDGVAEDVMVYVDGNAQDFYWGLDDSADDFIIGVGNAMGTTPAIIIDENQAVLINEKLTEVAAATNVITAAECGKTFFLNHATEFVSTLPAISTVGAGCQFDFIITAAAASANYTVITGNSKETKIQGTIDDANVTTACANEDTITFVDGNAVGDWARVIYDGSNWIVRGASLTDAKITCTDEV